LKLQAHENTPADFYQRKTEIEKSKVDVESLNERNYFMKQLEHQSLNKDINNSKVSDHKEGTDGRYEFKSSFAKRYFDE